MPDPTRLEPITPPALISEADLRTLAELYDAEAALVSRERQGWRLVASHHRALAHVAAACDVLQTGATINSEEARTAADFLAIYLQEARDNRRYYEKEKADPIRANGYAVRVGALERALVALRPLGAPRRELDDARDRQTERAGGEG